MREVSKQVGISAPYYSDLENSHRPITPGVLKKLRKVFNL
jgi:transcriptional regulator with XRE-family HTH domain